MENKGYKEFFVRKETSTYSETLEAFGLANLLKDIFVKNEQKGVSINIEDRGTFYIISSTKELTEELIEKTKYFQIVKFIKKKISTKLPSEVTEYFDYPEQNEIRSKYFNERTKIRSEQKDGWQSALKKLHEEFNGEFGKKVDYEFDVYREIQKNPYINFKNSYNAFLGEKDEFSNIIKLIFKYYSTNSKDVTLPKNEVTKKIKALSLYCPSQPKGLNKGKANGINGINVESLRFREFLKIKGALEIMRVRPFSVGKKWDNKIFVPAFSQIQLNKVRLIANEFKLFTTGTSSIKIDILGLLKYCELFIKKSPEYRGRIKNCIRGFHSVYQKQMNSDSSKPKSVMNISFLSTPPFISYQEKEEAKNWINLLKELQEVISRIEEQGDATKSLQYFRDFLGSGKAKNFYQFSFWYAGFLMRELGKDKKNKFKFKRFQIDSLNKIYTSMDTKFSSIIKNEGLLAVADAIRNSTVRLQYSQTKPKYKIRYGFAQQLQTKSKSDKTLKSFIGDFLGTYNAETARMYEKDRTTYGRERISDVQINQFFELFKSYSSQEIGAILASYGFAKKKFEEEEDKIIRLQEEAAKLGYELVKIEDEAEPESSVIEIE